MLRKIAMLVVFGVAGAASAGMLARPASSDIRAVAATPSFTLLASVTRVVDGDTIAVRYKKRNDRVRLIGIDSPEIGQCYSTNATAVAQSLASRRVVRLIGDRTQAKRDRYGRLLAYVVLPNGHDLGRDLLMDGAAAVYVFDRPFTRLPGYRAAEASARSRAAGQWGRCSVPPPSASTSTTTTTTTASSTTTATTTTTSTTTTTTTTSNSNCAASYPDVCIPPPPPDLDCGQIPYKNFRVRHDVPFPDPHRFDGDRDGIGCES
jgi:micrococcal nuclease